MVEKNRYNSDGLWKGWERKRAGRRETRAAGWRGFWGGIGGGIGKTGDGGGEGELQGEDIGHRVCAAPIHQPHDSILRLETARPRRAISSFILINNACQESRWAERLALRTVETIPAKVYDSSESHYSLGRYIPQKNPPCRPPEDDQRLGRRYRRLIIPAGMTLPTAEMNRP